MSIGDNAGSARSFRDLPLSELGGIHARRGFHLQDHIAAEFAIRMLLQDSTIIEVWCESLDDVLLVRQIGLYEEIEFIQVKNESPDQLWSVALVCQRDERRSGTSLIERSLARDCASERSSFRIVTSRQVGSELKVLTEVTGSFPRPSELTGELATLLVGRLGDCRSANSNDLSYWLKNCVWQVVPDIETLRASNTLLLMKVLDELGELSTPDRASELYTGLLHKVNEASLATEKSAKILGRSELRQWLLDSVRSAHLGSGQAGATARKKMEAAGLDSATIESALEQRRFYRMEVLRPKYLKGGDVHLIDAEVTARLQELRARLETDAIHESGVHFHQRCLDAVADLHGALGRSVPRPVLQGCMYDLTDRCLHRFLKASA